jgi:cation/acetate symporter
LYYMFIHSSVMQAYLGKFAPALWFDIAPISAGVFGVPVGIVTVIAVSLLFPDTNPSKQHII